MKPTVVTTGSGVISATGCACRDWASWRLKGAVADIGQAEVDDHEKRGEDESDPHERCADDSIMDVTEIDRKLRGQGAGHELGEGEALLVIGFGDPSPLLDQLAVHVAHEGDG